MAIVLGLDQGSTKTHALAVRDDGEVLALGSAAGSCYTMTGMEHATGTLAEAACQALEGAGAALEDVVCAAGGIAGIDYEYEVQLLHDAILKKLPVPELVVHNDCIGALWGGTFAPPAVVCCAGTGLNVGAVDENGKILVLGNYCHDLHQGGGSLGRDAIHAVCDAHIGKGPETALTQAILEYLSIPDVDTLLLREHRRHDINPSRLSPVIFATAKAGDAVAVKLITDLANHLADYALCAIRLSGMDGRGDIPVIITGGMFKGDPPIAQRTMARRLAEEYPRARLVSAVYEPVVGGAVMALYRRGRPGWQANLERSARAMGLVRKTAVDL